MTNDCINADEHLSAGYIQQFDTGEALVLSPIFLYTSGAIWAGVAKLVDAPDS